MLSAMEPGQYVQAMQHCSCKHLPLAIRTLVARRKHHRWCQHQRQRRGQRRRHGRCQALFPHGRGLSLSAQRRSRSPDGRLDSAQHRRLFLTDVQLLVWGSTHRPGPSPFSHKPAFRWTSNFSSRTFKDQAVRHRLGSSLAVVEHGYLVSYTASIASSLRMLTS